MKKIIFLGFFSSVLLSSFLSNLSLAESYPISCPVEAQGILSAVGGCSAIDCNTFSNICEKCCGQITPTPICTSFSYSNWSVCQSDNTQTRTVISIGPAGCTGGNSITSQSCIYQENLIPEVEASISAFESSKSKIESGGTIGLAFSGSGISKYKLYFSCPKFSTGINAGLLAGSAMINGIEYCNQEFSVPTSANTQNLIISSKYSKSLNITIRLRAYNFKDQYAAYKDVIIAVDPASSVNIPVAGTSTPSVFSTSTPITAPATPTTTSLQEQINFLLNQIKVLQQQLFNLQSSSVAPTASVAPPSSFTSAPISESITEKILSDELETFSYTWNNDLYYGLTNDKDVVALQNALTMEGCYNGPVNGNFFKLTRAGVICFQKKHNFTSIPGTGYIGPYTRKVLNDIYSR